MLSRHWLIIALLGVIAQAAAAQPDREFISGARSSSSVQLPFSDAVRVGDTLYISGQIGIDPKTDMAAADPRAEAKNVMDRVKATVERAGMTMDDVVSMQIHCTDLALYGLFNEIYRGYFPHGFPARAFLGASSLLRGARFEVMGIAVKRPPTGASGVPAH